MQLSLGKIDGDMFVVEVRGPNAATFIFKQADDEPRILRQFQGSEVLAFARALAATMGPVPPHDVDGTHRVCDHHDCDEPPKFCRFHFEEQRRMQREVYGDLEETQARVDELSGALNARNRELAQAKKIKETAENVARGAGASASKANDRLSHEKAENKELHDKLDRVCAEVRVLEDQLAESRRMSDSRFEELTAARQKTVERIVAYGRDNIERMGWGTETRRSVEAFLANVEAGGPWA